MKSSLTDESYLWGRFDANDGDNDGQIDINNFAELLWDLGLEFDDVYTYKAFQQISKDGDGKVSFEEFKNWWIVTQNDNHRLRSSRVEV
jgi:Ca2+-binding EF-hand superfamily protein